MPFSFAVPISSLWLGVLVVVSWGGWLHELILLLFLLLLDDGWVLVGGHSLVLLVSFGLHLGLGLDVLAVVLVESGGVVALLAPVIEVLLIFLSLGLGGGW